MIKQLSSMGSDIKILGAVVLAGLIVAVLVAINNYYNSAYNKGIEEGIKRGRVGYVKGYTGGTVAIEGYDGRGNDFNCKNGTWVFRGDQADNLKAGVEYDYNTIKKVFPVYAETYKRTAEAVCRTLGHKP